MIESMNHFTNRNGYNGIRSTPVWRFRASQPPGRHPMGTYFTTLPPTTIRLATRLGIPKERLDFLFTFQDIGDLTPLERGKGKWIFHTRIDYDVERVRQLYQDPRADHREEETS
jgi:hypothetical protein